ncbi:hypothetical protein O181_013943 [Austropuccinia psidii MF-1]|uniref:Uncharacterized protein n=1 Tax=Austropuccinia psidii MF-1 TaxID=1389203 RepID=A0A9Q3BZN4_9BASI|nr:hypothetical protein [Austropuccinia psidii MF-1]
MQEIFPVIQYLRLELPKIQEVLPQRIAMEICHQKAVPQQSPNTSFLHCSYQRFHPVSPQNMISQGVVATGLPNLRRIYAHVLARLVWFPANFWIESIGSFDTDCGEIGGEKIDAYLLSQFDTESIRCGKLQ